MSDKKRSKSKKGGKQSASSSSSSSASAQALSPLAQRLARCSRQTLEDALLETLGGVSGAEIDRILGEEVIQCPTSAALHVPSRSTFECVSPLANALLSRTLTNHTSAHAPHTRRTRVRTRPLAGKAPQTERGVERGHVLPRARHGSVRSDQFGERKYGWGAGGNHRVEKGVGVHDVHVLELTPPPLPLPTPSRLTYRWRTS